MARLAPTLILAAAMTGGCATSQESPTLDETFARIDVALDRHESREKALNATVDTKIAAVIDKCRSHGPLAAYGVLKVGCRTSGGEEHRNLAGSEGLCGNLENALSKERAQMVNVVRMCEAQGGSPKFEGFVADLGRSGN